MTTKRFSLLMPFIACAVFMFFQGSANATVTLPPVNTNIVNAPTAQFIGVQVTSASGKFAATVTPANPQFKDCTACKAWLDGATLTADVAKFTNVSVDTVWNNAGFLGYVGKCVDSNTGNSCSAVPE